MPRRVEDILPSSRRSVRDIPIGGTEEKKPSKKKIEDDEEKVIVRRLPDAVPITRPKRKSKLTRILSIIVGVIAVLAVLGYFASAYFVRAVFTITPKTVPVSVNSSYVANNVPKDGLLQYKIIKVEGSASSTVPSEDISTASAKASGALNIFNAYSPDPRKLIAGTRFSAPNGKIYKLSSTIMIPGYKTSSTGSIIPGMIKSTVIADIAGVESNIDGTGQSKSFKVVAYKDGDKYDKIYGELTGKITGGASGVKKTVSSTVLSSTVALLKSQIFSTLLAKLSGEISSEDFMFDKGYIEFYSEPQISGTSPNEANVAINGTIYGILFKRDDLVSKMAKQSITDLFGGLPYEPIDLDKMSFVISNKKDFNPEKGGALIMQLKGDIELTGKIPVNELKTKFAGISLTDTKEVMRSYAPIIDLDKTIGQVVPPWSKIPSNLDKISIIIGK